MVERGNRMIGKSVVSFDQLDLGSAKPTSVPQQTVEVMMTAELFTEYAKAFVTEAYRKNPLRAEQVQLTNDEVESYARYLLTKRIECVKGSCSDYRKLKTLVIPVWIQYNLSLIGEVVLRDKGLRFIPVEENSSTMTYEQAASISMKIESFMDDLQIVKDAMPRANTGNVDVMTTALIAGYVRGIEHVTHPIFTYVTAFMGGKLKEEMAWQVLYRVQYDDMAYIATALTSTRGLY